jgi:hypothetical protein
MQQRKEVTWVVVFTKTWGFPETVYCCTSFQTPLVNNNYPKSLFGGEIITYLAHVYVTRMATQL